MRIIGGQWKRTPLPVSTVEGLRPTPDRVRETVFNWLEHLQAQRWDNRRCLDLFAGSGALGFEAASRGAAEVVMVEAHTGVLRNLQAVCDKLKAHQVQLRQGDATQLLATLPGQFDLIFLDPPYQQQQLPQLLPACLPRLQPDGLVYIESDQPFVLSSTGKAGKARDRQAPSDANLPSQASNQSNASVPDWLAAWQILRSGKAGQVHFALLSPARP